jgi:transcriptional regulator of heat shock response
MDLTRRQAEILKAIIEEYMDSAQPIASVELVAKRKIPLSGATVRNIMADLVRNGFLEMMHVSSGRTPTDRAYRFYINDLMEEEPISVLEEMTLKQKIWDNREEIHQLIRSAAEVLSEVTGYMSFTITDQGYYYFVGASKMLELPEFYEIKVTKAVLKLMDDYELIKSVLDRNYYENSEVSVLIGKEIGLANMDPICLIFGRAMINKTNVYIGMLAPARTKYNKDIPLIKQLTRILDELNLNI